MDAKEAMKVVKSIKKTTQDYYDRHKGFYDMADVKEDVEKELAGINKAIEALEKQAPKEQGPSFWNSDRWSIMCPSCGAEIDDDSDFCKWCGQAIKNDKE